MARKKIIEKNSNTEDEEIVQSTVEITDAEEAVDDELVELPDEEVAEVVELSDIPIEQFLKDPKMSMITEETDVEETTAWCPVCNEHTIFVDKTCTVCGFTKNTKKSKDKDDEEESTESTFELMPSDDVIDEMNMYSGGYDDEEKADY